MPRGGLRLNAGRPGRELTVEDVRRIDIRELSRAGLMSRPWVGRWEWRDSETRTLTAWIWIQSEFDALTLGYRTCNRDVQERIAIERTSCHLGGRRPWFRCPSCTSRVAVLLLLGHSFRCRRCHGLAYRSQRAGPIERSWLAQSKLEGRLGPNWRRPKGMHHRTRERLLERIVQLEVTREELLAEAIGRLSGGQS